MRHRHHAVPDLNSLYRGLDNKRNEMKISIRSLKLYSFTSIYTSVACDTNTHKRSAEYFIIWIYVVLQGLHRTEQNRYRYNEHRRI